MTEVLLFALKSFFFERVWEFNYEKEEPLKKAKKIEMTGESEEDVLSKGPENVSDKGPGKEKAEEQRKEKELKTNKEKELEKERKIIKKRATRFFILKLL